MNAVVVRTLGLPFLTASVLQAQAPRLINYQGRIAAEGVDFDGTGLFKFALVDAAGTLTYWTQAAGRRPR